MLIRICILWATFTPCLGFTLHLRCVIDCFFLYSCIDCRWSCGTPLTWCKSNFIPRTFLISNHYKLAKSREMICLCMVIWKTSNCFCILTWVFPPVLSCTAERDSAVVAQKQEKHPLNILLTPNAINSYKQQKMMSTIFPHYFLLYIIYIMSFSPHFH